ncbi:MAG: hypothetical protein KA731_03580 [Candidatus Moranbacteria bacterium]|nr:hypothetical protein [Candidatus Moranbacteria bacterium]MBP6034270.1 hypothetical protein [Candidatus Moranbacteria bacterium]MBP7695904.1 hypothetical protein [Candidatus Moranbacteria bacterium]
MHIVGHHAARERLQRLAGHTECPQSFLFVGPESIGKRLSALEFSWSLLGRGGEFAGRTEAELAHPDVMLLEPERVTEKGKTREKNIPVEAIREAMNFLSRYPLAGQKRVLIIDDAHRLSRGAQNALLKTLEEPNPTSVLILVTYDPSALLDTVHSRLQRQHFTFVAEEEMQAAFRLPSEQAFWYQLGRPGVVALALREPEEFTVMRGVLGQLFRIGELAQRDRMRLAEDLAKDSFSALRMFAWWIPSLRQRALETDRPEEVRSVYALLDQLGEMEKILRGTQANARLQLEKLFLSIV